MKKQKLNQSHLNLDDREIIQKGIENRSDKTSIAKTIGKDPTTVAKEIKRHRKIDPRDVFVYPNICVHRKECKKCFKRVLLHNVCNIYLEG